MENATFNNPILPGFYPDPSMCRVGEDYYLVTSTFEYFPGIPIFHSKDLVNWRQIGHVLDRPSQLDLDGLRPSRGVFAPTIRYHEGTFYVINTNVDKKGNFVVTATDPAGPWSDPYWLESEGIDPSLFFDDDGKAYYTGTRPAPEGPQYFGNWEIWMQELDLKTMKLVGEQYSLWRGALRDAVWPEGPHTYKINGYYYLLISEGGTGPDHAITVARSEHLLGPYEGYKKNPVLTHRHLGNDYPIVNVGHSDIVQTQNGEWWMVLLASRPYGGYYRNLGRETFLVPFTWEEGWPVVKPGKSIVEMTEARPSLPEQRWVSAPACDNFETAELGMQWIFIRTPREAFMSLEERPGHLRLKLRRPTLKDNEQVSFVGRRQQHLRFNARTAMEFVPQAEHESAGLVVLQSSQFHFRFEYLLSEGTKVVRLTKCTNGVDEVLAQQAVDADKLYLTIDAHEQDFAFYYGTRADEYRLLAEKVDGRILSTDVAGGFVGTCLGMYASSNAQLSDNVADFDWFEYTGN
ncbi:glycoside hydrolase family 43 protein [Paenibacillus kobensis]|uniref:glycoside hydrolase family 43 protein n=1 Tax=Paenibacillus kobensis TaxID=59841 RepID=UPI000FDA2885|nr:glycoside hydrolase family 43 protein [Paenibacillus kobensis]